jgi:hypothetical protein
MGFLLVYLDSSWKHDYMNDLGGDLDLATYCGGSYTDLYIHRYPICTLSYM